MRWVPGPVELLPPVRLPQLPHHELASRLGRGRSATADREAVYMTPRGLSPCQGLDPTRPPSQRQRLPVRRPGVQPNRPDTLPRTAHTPPRDLINRQRIR